MNSQIIDMRTNKDGTIAVLYFGKEVGAIVPKKDQDGRSLYKALRLADDEIRNFGTIEAAREHCLGRV